MTQDTELRALFEEHCTTTMAFGDVLSALLIVAHENGVDVAGAWEAHENGSAPEWDVVVTALEREHPPESQGDEDTQP